jgi:predicted nucleic acid-binding protein
LKTIFVDSLYWIGLTNPKDQWHQKVVDVQKSLHKVNLITTELVLVEFLNYFCSYGSRVRQTTGEIVRAILADENVEVIFQSKEIFLAGLALYEQRLDKGYSMVDCISMQVMRSRNLTEVLTHDKHFSQEGFILLL